MTAEQFIASKASEAVKALYGVDFAPAQMQVGVTRKDFEGDYTLVVFPLLRISHAAPAATGQAIGEWLLANCPEFSAFNAVQGFLNLLFQKIKTARRPKEIIVQNNPTRPFSNPKW